MSEANKELKELVEFYESNGYNGKEAVETAEAEIEKRREIERLRQEVEAQRREIERLRKDEGKARQSSSVTQEEEMKSKRVGPKTSISSFVPDFVPITHFHSLRNFKVVLKREEIPHITLNDFLEVAMFYALVDEIIDKKGDYVLFTMSNKSQSIDEDIKNNIIDSDEKLSHYLNAFFDNWTEAGRLYLHDPKEELSQTIVEKEEADSVSSKPSRDSEVSKDIKDRSNNQCSLCGRHFPNSIGLEASHVYEVKSVPDNVLDRIVNFDLLGIFNVNDPRNYLCLCTRCHHHFDDYNVGIDPDTQEVLISPRIYDDPIEGAPGISKYRDLVEDAQGNPTHRKLVHVHGDVCKHPRPLLEYRKELYDVEQKSRMISKYHSLGKRKISEVEEDIIENLKQENRPYKKLTKPIMARYLEAFGLSTTGSKSELYERMEKLKNFVNEGFTRQTTITDLLRINADEYKQTLSKYSPQIQLDASRSSTMLELSRDAEQLQNPTVVGFTRLRVAGDGNCFFESLARLLNINGIDGMYLRALAVAELTDRFELYRESLEPFEANTYIISISQRGTWVDGVAMSALRNALFRCEILEMPPIFALYHAREEWWYFLQGVNDEQSQVFHFTYDGTRYDALLRN